MKKKDLKELRKLSREEIIALYDTYIPVVTEKICDQKIAKDGKVTLFIENKGVMNTIMQKLAHKPRFSQIHLDIIGSYIWQQCDGQTDIHHIADVTHEHFGEKVEPLYERLLKFFEVVESYDFIRWIKPSDRKE
ncbi:MAG: PqqD family protein [Bilifractor sp.]